MKSKYKLMPLYGFCVTWLAIMITSLSFTVGALSREQIIIVVIIGYILLTFSGLIIGNNTQIEDVFWTAFVTYSIASIVSGVVVHFLGDAASSGVLLRFFSLGFLVPSSSGLFVVGTVKAGWNLPLELLLLEIVAGSWSFLSHQRDSKNRVLRKRKIHTQDEQS